MTFRHLQDWGMDSLRMLQDLYQGIDYVVGLQKKIGVLCLVGLETPCNSVSPTLFLVYRTAQLLCMTTAPGRSVVFEPCNEVLLFQIEGE